MILFPSIILLLNLNAMNEIFYSRVIRISTGISCREERR
jgi:hypothetical protein